jgi:hypothetical protein
LGLPGFQNDYLALSRDTIKKLRIRLPAEGPLRQIFLLAPIIRKILGRPKTAAPRAKGA